MDARVSTFRYHAPEADLDDLSRRLLATRWPASVPGAGWAYGADLGFLQAVCRQWAKEFDWRRCEDRIFRLPNVAFQDPGGVSIHALHLRGEGSVSFPILLCHGWPGSFLEHIELAELLAFPSRFGGDPAQSFDVVVPSLPGFGFSSIPPAGFNHFDIAGVFARLMSALGYGRFAVHGGDIGASVAIALALRHADRLAGLHLNFIPFSYQPHLDGPPSADEQAFLDRRAAWAEAHGGYAHVQRTEPHTLAVGLNDSPAGLAAWLLQRYRDWSPPDADFLDPSRRDHVLATLTLYWLTGNIASSCRLYRDMRRSPLRFAPGERVTVPTAVACFPHELPLPPRSWVERGFNLQRWSSMPRGGHFAALDAPDLLAGDLRAFLRHGRC